MKNILFFILMLISTGSYAQQYNFSIVNTTIKKSQFESFNQFGVDMKIKIHSDSIVIIEDGKRKMYFIKEALYCDLQTIFILDHCGTELQLTIYNDEHKAQTRFQTEKLTIKNTYSNVQVPR